jgi:hypothetical protein
MTTFDAQQMVMARMLRTLHCVSAAEAIDLEEIYEHHNTIKTLSDHTNNSSNQPLDVPQ